MLNLWIGVGYDLFRTRIDPRPMCRVSTTGYHPAYSGNTG